MQGSTPWLSPIAHTRLLLALIISYVPIFHKATDRSVVKTGLGPSSVSKGLRGSEPFVGREAISSGTVGSA